MAVKRHVEEQPEWVESNRTLVMFTAIILILVSFFILLVSKANYDETKHGQVLESLKQSFGILPGGRKPFGQERGLPVDSLSRDQEDGELVVENAEMAKIRALLAPAVQDREARIIHTKGQKIISLSAGLLFPPDSAEINPEVAETLAAFAMIMRDSPVPVIIEAHTSDQPPQTEGVGDNWDISGARALAVLDYLMTEGELKADRLSARAYAGTSPQYPNNSPANRARNNRVNLVLDFDSLRSGELESLAEKAKSYNFRGFDFLLASPPAGPGQSGEARP